MNALAVIFTALLVAPALTSVVYFLLSARWLRRWTMEPEARGEEGELPPATFFRPLKAGVPNLAAKLETLARAMRADDQLLLGVEPGTPAAVVAGEVRAAFPERDIAVVPCAPGAALNPKISKLVQMEPLARHGHWILSDSEVALDAETLAEFRREWLGCDVLTAGYRFTGAATWPQGLDAAVALLTLWPGLVTLHRAGRMRLTLGACTGFRRDDVQAVGGWAAFAEELAEDHRLGAALANEGKSIRLSRSVVTIECDPLSWRDYWRHQRRVALTYRVANPAGFAGAWLMQGVTTSFVLACLHPSQVWPRLLFAAVWAVRSATVQMNAGRLQFPLRAPYLTVFVASLVETGCWALSWMSRSVWWSGTPWGLTPEGKLRRPAAR